MTFGVYRSPLFETEERKKPDSTPPVRPLCGARARMLGMEIRCVKQWAHDDPMAEVGSRQRDPLHGTMLADGDTTFEITWKSDA